VFYYQIAIISSPLQPLTYHYDKELEIGYEVEVTLQNKQKLGIVLKEVKKPKFKTVAITSITS